MDRSLHSDKETLCRSRYTYPEFQYGMKTFVEGLSKNNCLDNSNENDARLIESFTLWTTHWKLYLLFVTNLKHLFRFYQIYSICTNIVIKLTTLSFKYFISLQFSCLKPAKSIKLKTMRIHGGSMVIGTKCFSLKTWPSQFKSIWF